MPDSKKTVYEKAQIDAPESDRMQSLNDFAEDILGVSATNSDKTATSPKPKSAENPSPVKQSTQTYKEVSKQLADFYKPTQEQQQGQLVKKVDELLQRMKTDEQIQGENKRREQMMERSYQLAAQYLNPDKVHQMAGDSVLQIKTPDRVSVQGIVADPTSHLPQSCGDSALLARLSAPRNYGFNTAVGSSYRMGANTISACISEDQTVMQGQRVRLRLLQPLQAGEVIIPAGNLVTGSASIQGERLEIHVENLESGGNIIPVNLTVYDIDGQRGIFVPGSDTRSAAKEALANMGGSLGSSVSISRSAGQQVAMDLTRGVMQSGTQLLSQKIRTIKITLKAGYKVLLVSKTS